MRWLKRYSYVYTCSTGVSQLQACTGALIMLCSRNTTAAFFCRFSRPYGRTYYQYVVVATQSNKNGSAWNLSHSYAVCTNLPRPVYHIKHHHQVCTYCTCTGMWLCGSAHDIRVFSVAFTVLLLCCLCVVHAQYRNVSARVVEIQETLRIHTYSHMPTKNSERVRSYQ